MTNIEKYNQMMQTTLKLTDAELAALMEQEKGCWDSYSQMGLISQLEAAFGIECDLDDISDFVSYAAGLAILRRHGVEGI